MRHVALSLLLLFAAALPARAATNAMDEFARIPVVQDGRLKPLDSFARAMLKEISGSERPGGLEPLEWLAQVLFDPARASAIPIIEVPQADTRLRLGLQTRGRPYYSLDELGAGMEKTAQLAGQLAQADAAKLDRSQQEFLRVYRAALTYSQLLNSLSLILPLGADVPKEYAPQKQAFSEGPTYLELSREQEKLQEATRDIVKRKGSDPDKYNAAESRVASLALQLDIVRVASRASLLFRIMPPQWEHGDWMSPWQSVLDGKGSPAGAAYLSVWQDMAAAYRAGDGQALKKAATRAVEMTGNAPGVDAARMDAEIFYHRLNPFRQALSWYCASAVMLALAFWKKRVFLGRLGFFGLGGALAFHALGLALRIFILGRPPVGTLYESILFVSLVIGGACFFLALKRRDTASVLAGGLMPASLLLLAPVFAPDGDSLETLVAVLNTGFWLATHVLCITAGYGLCILTAAAAHLWLGKRVRDKALFKTMHRLSFAALLLTATGTALGGIWADQSWGRFWGWDPKENGALLIVLWLAWLQHGRIGALMSDAAYAAGLAALSIVVALSWFGVNLLGVGLHSYGFTSGIAAGLFGFCAAEMALIGFLWSRRDKYAD
jgi:ABC-type transport system involved in cytochrome c biogenesis permease subunit